MALMTDATATQTPAQASATQQRMAGEIWRTYDASKLGGAGFDMEDYNNLRGQQWLNNDIFRAAAASGNISSDVDLTFKNLNSKGVGYKKAPKEVVNAFKKKMGIFQGDLRGYEFVSLGGDESDPKNWRVKERPGTEENGNYGRLPTNGVVGYTVNAMNTGRLGQWNKKTGEAYTWGGINADGSANGLRGTVLESGGKKKLDGDYKSRDISWRLPEDMVDAMRQSQYEKSKSAYDAAHQTAGTGGVTTGSSGSSSSSSSSSTAGAGSSSSSTSSRSFWDQEDDQAIGGFEDYLKRLRERMSAWRSNTSFGSIAAGAGSSSSSS